MELERQPPQYKYWAFISYSHHDERWARRLHLALETYRIPKRIHAGPDGGAELPLNLYPVFRDRDELPSASSLTAKIREALASARSLVVVCSPSSAKSQWVNEEIRAFQELGRADRIFCVVVSGEPNALPGNEAACFAPCLYELTSKQTPETAQSTVPLAADMRPGLDDERTATLRLIAGILGVSYETLYRRDIRRRRQRHFREALAAVLGTILLAVTLVGLADGGFPVPWGGEIRRVIDGQEASLFRPVHRVSRVAEVATQHRRSLADALMAHARTGRWMGRVPGDTRSAPLPTVWVTAAAAAAALRMPPGELKPDEFRFFVQTVESAFSPDVVVEASGIRYGWRPDMGGERVLAPYTRIEPAAWVLSAVSLLHSRQSDVPAALRAKARSMVEYTQDVLMLYRSGDSGGWNVFPHQTNPDDQSTYGSAAVLIGLLDLAEADLPWLGSRERRDELILATTDWLLRRFEKSEGRAGWRASPGDPRSQRSDGLTLMIYSGLLREERLTGRPLPPEIVSELPKFLSYAVEQGPRGGQWSVFVETREFRNHLGVLTVADERTHVLWYPWALECARGWLERVKRVGGTRAELTQARRHLSRLVVDLGEAMVAEARDGDLTFVISETLYGLAPVGGQ